MTARNPGQADATVKTVRSKAESKERAGGAYCERAVPKNGHAQVLYKKRQGATDGGACDVRELKRPACRPRSARTDPTPEGSS